MGSPDEFHDDAHPQAREITGPLTYGKWGQCIAQSKQNDRRCHGHARGPHGKCNTHGGDDDSGAPEGNQNAEGNDGGASEGNTNSVSHGLYAETNHFYQEILDDAVRQLVDDIFTDYLEEYEELHGDPSTGTEAELFRIAVSYGKHVYADNWAETKPDSLDSGHGMVESETHYTEGGQKYYRYKESVVAAGQARLSRDRRSWLKDLGLMDDPQSKTADAIGSLKDAWKASAQDD